MRFLGIGTILFIALREVAWGGVAHAAFASRVQQVGTSAQAPDQSSHIRSSCSAQRDPRPPTISPSLFRTLEELARLVDIAYCVDTSGIAKPFQCASHCDDFPGFELVVTFRSGAAKSDVSGYVVLDHGALGAGHADGMGRIIVAFRGTYSIANTIADLSTVPQEYIPYPEDPDTSSTEPSEISSVQRFLGSILRPWSLRRKQILGTATSKHSSGKPERRCINCTVHTGFYTSWLNSRPYIIPHLQVLKQKYPEYQLHLVGHSFGGAIAALAALELEGDGWRTIVTTYGEPMIGNQGLRDFIDATFGLDEATHGDMERRYRRVTHIGDPVPLLPLREWGYRSHAGEIYITKRDLQPEVPDIRLCYGDEDATCITGSDGDNIWFLEDISRLVPVDLRDAILNGKWDVDEEAQAEEAGEMGRRPKRWPLLSIPTRYKLWEIFFAHRDYFWRLGLCFPGGDPSDWRRPHYNVTQGEGEEL